MLLLSLFSLGPVFSKNFSIIIKHCNWGGGVYLWAPLVAQRVKNLPEMRDTWVGSLGQEHPPEEGTATRCSILAWRIRWTEEPSDLQSTGSQSQVGLKQLSMHTVTYKRGVFQCGDFLKNWK